MVLGTGKLSTIPNVNSYSTAKIWDVETGKVKQTLEGHSHATAVLSLANGIIVTGS